jgi:DNA-directed RNA polymerase II subunit RPB2
MDDEYDPMIGFGKKGEKRKGGGGAKGGGAKGAKGGGAARRGVPDSNEIAWQIIHSYFRDNPHHITKHHLDSYNRFLHDGIPSIFKQHNPMKIMKEKDDATGEFRLNCDLYFGGEDGSRIYYGKPIIYEDDGDQHYMMPNEARLRNMTYGMSIYYDVLARFREVDDDGEVEEYEFTIERVLLGRFPIMLHSDVCALKSMPAQARFFNGECAEDPGGYFIIDGKEKVIVSQEQKFADNVLNIKARRADDPYTHSADIRTVSEDPSKPQRTLSVRMVAPTPTRRNGNIVVNIPNVRAPVPLFIVMRALGVTSDKEIIQTCLLDLEKQEDYVDLFIPSVHDASVITTQELAIEYISSLTKYKTTATTMHILMDLFLPNVGDLNFREKAIYLGYIVNRLLRVYAGDDEPTDRDSFLSKRIELSGALLTDLFTEYYKLQFKNIFQNIDKRYYYQEAVYQANFRSLIESNPEQLFAQRIVEKGIMKGMKGAWGSQEHTRRPGVTQELNRLSFFSFISHLRKLNLPMESSAKVVKPRLLHNTQWGLVCPVETPDGGNIGFHKHMTITAQVTAGEPAAPMRRWLFEHGVYPVTQMPLARMYSLTKVFVNGVWIGATDAVEALLRCFKLYRRNGLISMYNSIRWDIKRNELHVQTDGGRLMRPILFVEDGEASIFQRHFLSRLGDDAAFDWTRLTSGYLPKKLEDWAPGAGRIYEPEELYTFRKGEAAESELRANQSVVELLDTAESEGALISVDHSDFKSPLTTHAEIHPSLILGVMGNMIVFPENNQFPRDLFSCGQGKQGVSTYHGNWQNRIDKMGVVLNYAQNPLVQSRYYSYITRDVHPYGENAIVAICAYNGYNVEDALIFNRGAIDRGLFRTTYLNSYETREESSTVGGGVTDVRFSNVVDAGATGQRPGYDYAYLDEQGLIRENTYVNDKMTMIGKVTLSSADGGSMVDSSVFPKKGQKGYVDKAFITEGEEGRRIAKVRIREERRPAIGDKLCSRAGQKGTVGIVLPEEDMPFTRDGIRPDLIVNPHALPSRMTIGQLVECIMGKAGVMYGGYGDCTAYVNKGPKHVALGNMLVKQGFHSSGNELLMNGMTGGQLESDIFIGPTYYLRLKHMVKDKINYRATGPRTQMTRQTVHGRANDGGLRVGEMERDGIISHGMSSFLNESMLVRGDDYYMAVCNRTGAIAVYNEKQNLFLSPQADGPLYFSRDLEGGYAVENKSVHGRDFSVVRVPYCFKLLLQELKTMNVVMRIITEDNVERLTGGYRDKDAVRRHIGVDGFEEVVRAYNEAKMGAAAEKVGVAPEDEAKADAAEAAELMAAFDSDGDKTGDSSDAGESGSTATPDGSGDSTTTPSTSSASGSGSSDSTTTPSTSSESERGAREGDILPGVLPLTDDAQREKGTQSETQGGLPDLAPGATRRVQTVSSAAPGEVNASSVLSSEFADREKLKIDALQREEERQAQEKKEAEARERQAVEEQVNAEQKEDQPASLFSLSGIQKAASGAAKSAVASASEAVRGLLGSGPSSTKSTDELPVSAIPSGMNITVTKSDS